MRDARRPGPACDPAGGGSETAAKPPVPPSTTPGRRRRAPPARRSPASRNAGRSGSSWHPGAPPGKGAKRSPSLALQISPSSTVRVRQVRDKGAFAPWHRRSGRNPECRLPSRSQPTRCACQHARAGPPRAPITKASVVMLARLLRTRRFLNPIRARRRPHRRSLLLLAGRVGSSTRPCSGGMARPRRSSPHVAVASVISRCSNAPPPSFGSAPVAAKRSRVIAPPRDACAEGMRQGGPPGSSCQRPGVAGSLQIGDVSASSGTAPESRTVPACFSRRPRVSSTGHCTAYAPSLNYGLRAADTVAMASTPPPLPGGDPRWRPARPTRDVCSLPG
jgi:hypothetical protein